MQGNFLFKKKFLFNILISMKFILEMYQVIMKPKSLLIFFPSSKFPQKKSLKKIFNFWVEFISGTFFEKFLNWGGKFITDLAL